MAHAIPRPPAVTRGMVLGTLALVAFTLGIASLGHDAPTDPGRVGERPVAARDLRFEDRADGAVVVRDARTGQVIETLEPGTEGFVRASMRGLVRQRRLAGIGSDQPFRLATWQDGRVTLLDTATGNTMELHAFGRTNAEAYLKLLATGE